MAQFVKAAAAVQRQKGDNSEQQLQQSADSKVATNAGDSSPARSGGGGGGGQSMTIRYQQFQPPNLQNLLVASALPLEPKNMVSALSIFLSNILPIVSGSFQFQFQFQFH